MCHRLLKDILEQFLTYIIIVLSGKERKVVNCLETTLLSLSLSHSYYYAMALSPSVKEVTPSILSTVRDWLAAILSVIPPTAMTWAGCSATRRSEAGLALPPSAAPHSTHSHLSLLHGPKSVQGDMGHGSLTKNNYSKTQQITWAHLIK